MSVRICSYTFNGSFNVAIPLEEVVEMFNEIGSRFICGRDVLVTREIGHARYAPKADRISFVMLKFNFMNMKITIRICPTGNFQTFGFNEFDGIDVMQKAMRFMKCLTSCFRKIQTMTQIIVPDIGIQIPQKMGLVTGLFDNIDISTINNAVETLADEKLHVKPCKKTVSVHDAQNGCVVIYPTGTMQFMGVLSIESLLELICRIFRISLPDELNQKRKRSLLVTDLDKYVFLEESPLCLDAPYDIMAGTTFIKEIDEYY